MYIITSMRGINGKRDRFAHDAGGDVGDGNARRAVRLHQERTALDMTSHTACADLQKYLIHYIVP